MTYIRRILIFSFVLIIFYGNFAYCDFIWANKVLGYSTQVPGKQYSAIQVRGEPSIMPDFGKSPSAWYIPRSKKTEWIRVSFPKMIPVKQVGIYENINPGGITSVYLYDSLGNGHKIFSNVQPKPQLGEGSILQIFPDEIITSQEIKIEINLTDYFEDYQIDAIYISESSKEYPLSINLASENSITAEKGENLGSAVNSYAAELAPVISQDGKRLYFTRDGHEENTGPYLKQDIWYSDKDSSGVFKTAQKLPAPINNSYANFLISATTDGNRLLLGNIYSHDGAAKQGFSFTTKIKSENGTSWSFPDSISIQNYYNNSPTGSYSLASDGTHLLLALDREDSFGSTDIYMSKLNYDGSWSEPQNLGPVINTASEEATPFLASDGKTLYFSTAGRPGVGENDIFMSKRLDSTWTNWSLPQNLGSSINTSGWDAYFTIPAAGDYAYYVSNQNTIGREDIMRIKLQKEAAPEIVVLVRGRVLNSKTNEPLSAQIIYELLPSGEKIGNAISNPESGEYQIVLPGGEKYGFLAKAEGYVAVNQNLDLTKASRYEEIEQDLILVPIEKGQTIRLNNIFFEFGEYSLLEDSYSELRRVADLMRDNTDMRIQINGHTDSIGNKEDNLILSRRRAEAVRTYLISLGIDAARLEVRGFGKSKPLSTNATDEGRKINRRVEFEILER